MGCVDELPTFSASGISSSTMLGLTSMSALPPTAELFERYAAMCYRRCLELLGTPDLAGDAVQAIFVRVLEHRGSYRGQSSPIGWLYGIATLHCLQQLRNQSLQRLKLAAE